MPFTLPPRTPSGPRRRSLFASAAGAFVLVGCSAPEPSTVTTVRSPSAADLTRARAARDSESLAARYAAVITAHPPLAGRLKPLRAEVVRHAQAFGGSGTAGSRPSGSPSASASAHPSPSPTVPAQEKDALADLATAERTLADQRTKALLTVPGELARLLASVAAAGAAHAFLLTEGAK
ncbi:MULTISPECIES: hypothetical protein [Streptomyces]|uniref:hypothetical protein n=1 Tax=Streptomyces TaxID=1883 RepID=UPI000BCB662D|nr:hypothetical protein [Streptomyces sp. OK228]SOE30875.1 hypothetical protein SAMN05442782_7787 [Streptomyces sp. OK228]